MTNRIVVMGGSFNPPTVAHLRLRQAGMDAIDACAGIFVPTDHEYVAKKMRKLRRPQDVMSESLRVEMLESFKEQDSRIVISRVQMLREGIGFDYDMLNAIQQGILTRSTKERLEELEAARDDLENKIACEKLAKPRISEEFITFWLHRFRKLDVTQKSHRKMLIDTFVNAIFLYDDKVEITYNYHEGTTTVTFEELQKTIENQELGSDMDSVGAPRNP